MANKEAFHKRKVDTRVEKERFLICCEGAKTEPNYFESFRLPTKKVVELDIRGAGFNTDSLVKETMRLKDEGDYDQIWCVFDRDSFKSKNFNDAIELAKNNNIKVAYSNQSFELWYLLHFNYHDTAMSRKDYVKKLEVYLKHYYQKNSETIYDEILGKQQIAIRNATKLLKTYQPNLSPEKDDPSTTVHILVSELNKFITY